MHAVQAWGAEFKSPTPKEKLGVAEHAFNSSLGKYREEELAEQPV